MCASRQIVSYKKKTTRCTSRSAALTAMNCLPTKITRGLTMEQEARWPMYRSDGRTAFKIHRQKNTDKMRRRRCHPRCGEHQHCQTKKEGMQSHSYVQAGPYSPPSRKELKRRTSSFMFHKTNLSSRLAHTGLEDTLRSFCEPLIPH